MTKDVWKVLKLLEKYYPNPQIDLDYSSTYELLVATILSAQCTDERVNKVTAVLFEKYPTPKSLANADMSDVKKIIRTTGFFNNKTKNIIGASQVLVNSFGSKVPDNMEDLLTLPGVARKTANVILHVCFNKSDGIVIDTHVKRISRLIGLTDSDSPEKIEKDLMRIFPKDKWKLLSMSLVLYGRYRCKARKHDETQCFLGHSKIEI